MKIKGKIADKEYTKLVSTIPPKLSWAIDAEPTPENACLGFWKWLVEQLAMWEEDYDKELNRARNRISEESRS